jgi:hypothetical protein
MDVDKDGKASGEYLRARVSIELAQPLRRGVLLKTKKNEPPYWFDIEYENLPFFCLSCGIMGHSHLECDKPLIWNSEGKLPYDVKLRVFEPKKKKVQSFSEAAADLFDGATSASKHAWGSVSHSEGKHSKARNATPTPGEEEEVSSPLKPTGASKGKEGGQESAWASCQMFQPGTSEVRRAPRMKKTKASNPSHFGTPNLNLPATDTLAVVPSGLVSARVNQIVGEDGGSSAHASATLDELTKK